MSLLSLPKFSQIDVASFAEKLDHLLAKNRQKIDTLLAKSDIWDWDTLMRPLEDLDDQLERFWAPLSHLHAVVNSPELRQCYQACLPKLAAYEAAIGQNKQLYDAICTINTEPLSDVQRKIIKDTLRDFELSGVALSDEKKARFEAIQARLSDLSNQFDNQVLDAGQAVKIHITDLERLRGIPEHAVSTAKQLAQEKELTGWLFNLEIPSYLAIVTYAEDRALREEAYYAYVTRASDKGPFAGKFDNTAVINELLALRHEKAQLLGFANYAELSIATKMAESTQQVLDFLYDLRKKAHAKAAEEMQCLREFAKDQGLQMDIAPWDIAYLSEKKQQALFAISQEALRPYFPLPKVLSGMFTIINKLYGVQLQEVSVTDKWHTDVACYQVTDDSGLVRGYIYTDFFARPNKRGGAWMDSCQSRRRLADGGVQVPIATLTCNFAKTGEHGMPSALSHDEVLTLFHEFGHCLHHVLTKVDYLSVSGINGVEWDAVELPSQFFENWCWEEEAIQLLTAHTDTGEPLPTEVFRQLRAAKNFQAAMAIMRQLEFSIFDFRIHQDYQATQPEFVANVLADVRQSTAVVPIASYNRFQHSFSHIFAGGYAAGYYSYKWAEVLSSDAFSRFEEEGIFNTKTGHDFLRSILEVGGSYRAADAYRRFRGRAATVDAMLRHEGILSGLSDGK